MWATTRAVRSHGRRRPKLDVSSGAMAVPDSYLNSVKNLGLIFASITSAGVPERFTHDFLKQLGFASSSDRAVIPLLKALRFLDDNSVPTERYRRFRDPAIAKMVMSDALRDAYSDLFVVNEKANEMSHPALTGAFKRITGKGDAVSEKMASTFRALSGLADWSTGVKPVAPPRHSELDGDSEPEAPRNPSRNPAGTGLFPVLRHDVHIHLPATTDVQVYDAIFRSLREQLG